MQVYYFNENMKPLSLAHYIGQIVNFALSGSPGYWQVLYNKMAFQKKMTTAISFLVNKLNFKAWKFPSEILALISIKSFLVKQSRQSIFNRSRPDVSKYRVSLNLQQVSMKGA